MGSADDCRFLCGGTLPLICVATKEPAHRLKSLAERFTTSVFSSATVRNDMAVSESAEGRVNAQLHIRKSKWCSLKRRPRSPADRSTTQHGS